MNVSSKIVEPYVDSFESYSRDAIVRNLDAFEPNWRWAASAGHAGDWSLNYCRQQLESASIASAENAGCLEALARRDMTRISIFFVLAGEIEISDRRESKALRIPANCVASIRESSGKRLSIRSRSRWLAFHIPEATLRQYFEELTSRPYVQEFVLPPTSLRQGDAKGLYQTLRQAEQDLKSARPEERAMLANAYQQLALVKLFAKMPHNLAEAFRHGALAVAPRQLLRAEAYIRDNLGNPITLEDLAAAAGCGPRALQRMFRTYRGDSPMGILCNYRLAAAHSRIKAGMTDSITELAMSLQFSNPGRFSFLYKSAYGVSPSSTLRFARDEGRTNDDT